MTNLFNKLTPTAQSQIASLSIENKTLVKNILKSNKSTLEISIDDIYTVINKIGYTKHAAVVDFMALFVYQDRKEMHETVVEIFWKDLCRTHGLTA